MLFCDSSRLLNPPEQQLHGLRAIVRSLLSAACKGARPSDAQGGIWHPTEIGHVDATPLKKIRKLLKERGSPGIALL